MRRCVSARSWKMADHVFVVRANFPKIIKKNKFENRRIRQLLNFFYRKLLHIVRLDYLPPMSNSSNTAIVSKVIRDNLGLHGSFFTSLRDCSRKFAPLSKPIRCKTQTNHDLVNRVFPRFRQLNCLYFEFSLALKGIFLSFDWPL